jgi:hypothetical protein
MPSSLTSSPPLGRRTFLRGAGALAALPFLEALAPRTLRAGMSSVKPPLRMGIFTVAGGTVPESFVPTETGALGKMPSILRCLESNKSEVLVLSNFSQAGKSENANGHQHCAFLHLTAADKVAYVNQRAVAPQSVDQRAAELLADQSLYPSLCMGYAGGETQYSFTKEKKNIPYEKDPRQIFESLFKGRPLVAPNWTSRAQATAKEVRDSATPASYDKQVVDLILEDAKRLNKKLGKSDQQKLGEYLEAVDGMERRLQSMEKWIAMERRDVSSPGPSNPHKPDGMPADLGASQNLLNLVMRNPGLHGEYIRMMSDLMVLAFQTDTTRVCTLGVGNDDALFPGVVTVGYEYHAHTLEHQGNAARLEDADPVSREGCRQIHAWYTQLFANMIEKMRHIDEGGTSLLDNSMILYTSYMSNGGHGTTNYPAVLAGRAGGTLKTGRHIAYQKETPMANLYVEMLSRLGDQRGEFGNSRTSPKAAYDGRLPDLV